MIGILAAAAVAASCSVPVQGEMRTFADCVRSDASGAPRMAPHLLARVSRDAAGLGQVHSGGAWWYVDRTGRMVKVVAFDNGPDPFMDGLARAYDGRRIGFVDRRLRFAFAQRFDGALPFQGGHARVCTGCRLERHGEHGGYVGGRWSCIDRRGRVVKAGCRAY